MIKKTGFFILKKLNLLSFYSLKKSGYLYEKGWFLSFKSSTAIDLNRKPIPWMTYSFIDFLEKRLHSKMKVFEFGSGNSTIWWSKKVESIKAIESNEEWYNHVNNGLENNISIALKSVENGDYANELLLYKNEFDIISIDGMDRVNCARNCLEALTEDGVVIWDNSDRKEYQEGYDFLTSNGFKRIDFHGLGPINVMAWTTSVFYKSNNCLGI